MSKPILGYEPGPEADNAGTNYRYFVDGELIREFKEEWQAKQYFDEDRANCEKLAEQHDVTMKRSLYDDTGYRSVVIISDVCRPGEEHNRPKFVRVDRAKLCTTCKQHGEESA